MRDLTKLYCTDFVEPSPAADRFSLSQSHRLSVLESGTVFVFLALFTRSASLKGVRANNIIYSCVHVRELDVGLREIDLGVGDEDVGEGELDLGVGDLDVGLGELDVGFGDGDVGEGEPDVGVRELYVGVGDVDVGLGDLL